jgi:Sec-independent protein translocase protein TatA
MDFLGMGPMEVGVVLLVAFLIWGPEKVIEISRSLGRIVHNLKKAAGDFSTQLNQELDQEKKMISEEKKQLSKDLSGTVEPNNTPNQTKEK